MQRSEYRYRNQMLASLLVSALIAFTGSMAKADATRDFMLSATYGTLAGTLVGAATLAFSERPGENLNKVARGASLGLYAGLLLGLYVVYGNSTPSDDDVASARLSKPFVELDLLVAPVLTERGLEGAQANYTFLRF